MERTVDVKRKFAKIRAIRLYVLVGLFVLTVVAVLVSLLVGQSNLTAKEALSAFFGLGSDKARRIVWYVRMPRIVAAVLVGFGLAISGQVMQTTLRNPLASPSTLGVSNAAVFGANLAIVLGAGAFGGAGSTVLNINDPYVVTLSAFAFSYLSVLFIVFIARFRKFSPAVVVLLGVAFGALFTALTTFIQYLASDQVLSAAVYWSFGDLSRASYLKIAFVAACVAPSFIVFFFLGWKYNALSAGEDTARSLGVRIDLLRLTTLLLASLITAVCVSFFGVIGFIGVVCPQLMKRFVGSDSRILLPSAGLAGSFLLVVSDTVSRVIVPGLNVPVGAVTAVLGAPVFLYVLLRRER